MEAECGLEPTDNLWSKRVIAEAHQECRELVPMVPISFYVITMDEMFKVHIVENKTFYADFLWQMNLREQNQKILFCNMLQHQLLLKCLLLKKIKGKLLSLLKWNIQRTLCLGKDFIFFPSEQNAILKSDFENNLNSLKILDKIRIKEKIRMYFSACFMNV